MEASLPILAFHSLDDRLAPISFSPRVFQRGIVALHETGYQALRLLEAVDCLRQGKSFPARSFVMTFDDGYQTVYEKAFPVLQRYGISATVFLTVGEKRTAMSGRLPSLEGRSMLSWQEIQEMHRWGIDFGAHTLTHPVLTGLPGDRIKAEICGSKAIIEDVLGAPVDSFAYPYGRYDHRSREIVQDHFTCACSAKLSLVTASSDQYALERIDTSDLQTDRLFDLMVTRLFPSYVLARSTLRRIRRFFQLRSE